MGHGLDNEIQLDFWFNLISIYHNDEILSLCLIFITRIEMDENSLLWSKIITMMESYDFDENWNWSRRWKLITLMKTQFSNEKKTFGWKIITLMKFIFLMKVQYFDENSSLRGIFTIWMKIYHLGENSSFGWILTTLMKIGQIDENHNFD